MQLISREGFVDDPWRRLDEDGVDGAGIPLDGDIIIDHHRLTAFTAANHDAPRTGRTGLHIENDASVPGLHNVLAKLDLISIEFPATSDGRGFSLARQIREQGFQGELRACGPLIVDQFSFALACGFDTLEIPEALAERQPEAQWLAVLDEIEPGYQPDYASPIDVLRRRHPEIGRDV